FSQFYTKIDFLENFATEPYFLLKNISSRSIEVLDELDNRFISYSDILENKKVDKIVDTRTQSSKKNFPSPD
ncbi:hypothetical protein, partial [Pseudolactococcus raffinolactis]|uniref:hypothetical protein n=1 Tax=Pseudolactococcus raffinolactis TaxID=1366 RepID=UPI00216A532D